MFVFAPRWAIFDDGGEKERVAMTPPEIPRALSLGHERWLGDAVTAASSQRSEVSSLRPDGAPSPSYLARCDL
jgi:hypothetical protein